MTSYQARQGLTTRPNRPEMMAPDTVSSSDGTVSDDEDLISASPAIALPRSRRDQRDALSLGPSSPANKQGKHMGMQPSELASIGEGMSRHAASQSGEAGSIVKVHHRKHRHGARSSRSGLTISVEGLSGGGVKVKLHGL